MNLMLKKVAFSPKVSVSVSVLPVRLFKRQLSARSGQSDLQSILKSVLQPVNAFRTILAMYLCDSKWNFTIGMYISLHMEELISIDETGTRVKGLYGDPMFKPISNPKGRPFKCRLVGEYYVGRKLSNSSFDGAIGLLEKGLIDVYMKVLNPLISGESDKITLSPPLNDEE